MRIIGQVLTEGAGTPLGGVTVRIGRRGGGNILLNLMTNSKGEFESELSDDFLVEAALVFSATREGYLETSLERAPAPEMQVAIGIQPVHRAPEPKIQPPPQPTLLQRVRLRLKPVGIVLVIQGVAQFVLAALLGVRRIEEVWITYLGAAVFFLVVYGLILYVREKRADQKTVGAGGAPPP